MRVQLQSGEGVTVMCSFCDDHESSAYLVRVYPENEIGSPERIELTALCESCLRAFKLGQDNPTARLEYPE